MTGTESDEPKKPSQLAAFEKFVLAGTDMKPLIPTVKWRHMIEAQMARQEAIEALLRDAPPRERYGRN